MNEFISFWFYTSVNGEELYETDLDFHSMEWRLSFKDTEDSSFNKEPIRKYRGINEEEAEIKRIKTEVERIIRSKA